LIYLREKSIFLTPLAGRTQNKVQSTVNDPLFCVLVIRKVQHHEGTKHVFLHNF